MNKKLQRQIEKQLYKLQKLLEQIGNHDIHPTEPELWDPDYYYDLAENLKEALQMLESKKATTKYGETIILEEGLCALIDDYQSEAEEEEADE